MQLQDKSRVAVLGGGPSGSLFSYFLHNLADAAGINISVDIFEAKNFCDSGPRGCNYCGGIISESLVQMLATEGINLPAKVVQRGIDTYTLHTDMGTVCIETPLHEKRIAAIHRGSGPKGSKEFNIQSFDYFLLNLARENGANLIKERVINFEMPDGLPTLKTRQNTYEPYDLLVVACGVNSSVLDLFQNHFNFKPPLTTKTYICELPFGKDMVNRYFGNSMHVFLLDMPGLKFAAFIPKGDFVTLCLIGRDITSELINTFLRDPVVKKCLPEGWQIPDNICHCSPEISIEGATEPYGDRIIFIGDAGVSRLYKDGIGAAYRTSKAAARTAIFDGISAKAFGKGYKPTCDKLTFDNKIGKIIYIITNIIQKNSIFRRGVIKMVAREQKGNKALRPMSTILWDTFTGSAPYRDVFMRAIHPSFFVIFFADVISGLFSSGAISCNNSCNKR
jgi:flavin-dependent dehydrogenase